MKEDFSYSNREKTRPENISPGYEMPGLQEIPHPVPEKGPAISPEQRQQIIDDMNREDEADQKRQERIHEIIRKRDLR